jgi:molybdopterin-guanine dinucleotide biosynthesis protein
MTPRDGAAASPAAAEPGFRYPAFGICGYSGAGKTTLIEAHLPRLTARGWRIAVVKQDAHGLSLDRGGKDSDRLFRAGADIVIRDPDQVFIRRHARVDDYGRRLRITIRLPPLR